MEGLDVGSSPGYTSMDPLRTTDEPPEDKWAAWNSLKSPVGADRYLRSIGIELHAGSTKDEIDRAVRIYRASW